MDVPEMWSFFIEQVRGFVDMIVKYYASRKTNQIRCPCRDCENKKV
jgi:hypothetical protein